MRKLNQFLVIAAISLLSVNTAKAQLPIPLLPKAMVFGNVTYVSPQTDTFKNNYKDGYGVEVGGGVGLGSVLIYGSVGYQRFTSKSNKIAFTAPQGVTDASLKLGNLELIPVKVGVKKYFLGKLFVNAAGGVTFGSASSTATGTVPVIGVQTQTSNLSGRSFTYEIGAGVSLIKHIEVGAAYSSFKDPQGANVASLLFRAGYVIKI